MRTDDKWSRSNPHQQKVLDLWKKHGGDIHGPHIETVTIPESQFYKFLEEFLHESTTYNSVG